MGTITCELESSYAATAGAGAGDAKVKLHGKLGVPHVRSWFAFAGNGTYNGLGLFVLRRRTNVVGGGMLMQVFVRTVAGRSLALDVSPSDTVAAVKARIQAKERVAAADQRLVYAGRDLDDGRRTLAEYGVRKEANLFLHLRLRGGAVGDDVGAADAGGTRCWATAVGALATVVAVGSALAYFPAAAAAAGTGGLTLAFLLLMWALAVAGVNLITAGVCLTGRAETLCRAVQSAMLSKASAFLRQNLSVIGVAAASSAATGVVVGVEDRALCFISFALFLVAMSLVTIGVASCAR